MTPAEVRGPSVPGFFLTDLPVAAPTRKPGLSLAPSHLPGADRAAAAFHEVYSHADSYAFERNAYAQYHSALLPNIPLSRSRRRLRRRAAQSGSVIHPVAGPATTLRAALRAVLGRARPSAVPHWPCTHRHPERRWGYRGGEGRGGAGLRVQRKPHRGSGFACPPRPTRHPSPRPTGRGTILGNVVRERGVTRAAAAVVKRTLRCRWAATPYKPAPRAAKP
jgi:hypothetical protein